MTFSPTIDKLAYAFSYTQKSIRSRQHTQWGVPSNPQRPWQNRRIRTSPSYTLQSHSLTIQKGIYKDAKDHEARVKHFGDNQPIVKPPKTIVELVSITLSRLFKTSKIRC
jgi:hypothetical protein